MKVARYEVPGKTPKNRPVPYRRYEEVRSASFIGWIMLVAIVRGQMPESNRPIGHPQPHGRGVQFGLGAVLQYSNTPSLRAAGFEDEDDDEDEAPCEA